MPALRRSRPALPRYAVAWFPHFEQLQRIEEFRRRHDPAAALVPAHLSLVFPFATALSRLQVETHVQRVASRWPPVAVSFQRVRLHANEFLFLMASRGAAALGAFHDKLYTRSLQPHLRREFPYEPHITLARYADFARLESALAEADEAFGAEFSAVMREVTLLSVEPNGRIGPLKSISLHTA